ncbi:type III secretion apparatus protein RspB [Pseudomonas sp. CCM 7891]|uniref:Type III secretion apparatus protein RspB n=1 Tax=Pseudomonas karstica TaxID=1055468 RepID=A0A7X2UZA3_9PSED|nr:EscI/YscI/HrpB family type III secretion system inner rod protein [Pseudomonas karstica]MTD19947.1 type III secretion apparatus protein RspB [Pseudomonas karstica]
MRIDEYISPGRTGPQSSYKTPDSLTSSTDVDFFTSTLERSSPPITATVTAGASSLLTGASEQLINSKNRLNKSLKAISKDANMDELKKYPKELSNSLLMSQLLVKSLGKASQCIEKITNLQ